MKKLRLFAVVFALILLVGCSKEKIEYNAVYELEGGRIKTYLRDGNIYYKIESDAVINSGYTALEKNKIPMDIISEDATFEFKKGYAVLKANYQYLKSGKYKNIGVYTNEEFYNDFYGDINYLNSEISGIYSKDNMKLNVFQIDEDSIRSVFNIDDQTYDLEMDINETNQFYLEFFDDIYTLEFSPNKLVLDIQTEEDYKDILQGTYTKESNIELDYAIKNIDPR